MTEPMTLIVGKIEDQGDRVLLYDRSDPRFYVIASPLQAAGARPGDTVTYAPYGVNFGFFMALSR